MATHLRWKALVKTNETHNKPLMATTSNGYSPEAGGHGRDNKKYMYVIEYYDSLAARGNVHSPAQYTIASYRIVLV